jgi:threonylcarbamoyladenosine tRNA methylthiotransferase MtaB
LIEEVTKPDSKAEGDTAQGRLDFALINTCAVTGAAEAKFRKALRRFRRERPDALVAVTGCFANRLELFPEPPEQTLGADLVFKMGDFDALAEFLQRHGLAPVGVEASARGQSYFAEHTRAFLKIQDGCDRYCAYCIVPHVRPKLFSEPPDRVVAAINELSAKGYNEVTLTGIHLGFYGRDVGGFGLADLLSRIDGECDIARVRLSSIEISEVTDEIIDLIAGSGKFCRHLHLPLQSGADEVLARMGRAYKADFFADRVDEIRNRIPDVGVTTDVIVGFPGETDEQFEQTAQMVEKIGFAKTHVFRFSPRPGARAAEMRPRVAQGTISSRARKLVALADEVGRRFRERFVGQTLETLIEGGLAGSGVQNGSVVSGFSSNYIRIGVSGAPADVAGRIARVRLTDAGDESGVARGVFVGNNTELIGKQA